MYLRADKDATWDSDRAGGRGPGRGQAGRQHGDAAAGRGERPSGGKHGASTPTFSIKRESLRNPFLGSVLFHAAVLGGLFLVASWQYEHSA